MLNKDNTNRVHNFLPLPESEVISRYIEDGLSLREVAKIYNCTKTVISRVLRENNIEARSSIKSREHSINDKFFDHIDSHVKAYILGLIYADGCVHGSNRVSLSLQEPDKYILEAISSRMESTYPITYYTPKNPKRKTQYKISFRSNQVFQRLLEIGCTQRKSLTLEYPTEVPFEFENSFVLGYFDGDGSIYAHKGGWLCFSMVGTSPFLLSLQSVLVNNCDVKYTKLYSDKRTPLLHSLSYAGNKQIKRIRDFMYKDSELYLTRKKNTFYSFKEEL